MFFIQIVSECHDMCHRLLECLRNQKFEIFWYFYRVYLIKSNEVIAYLRVRAAHYCHSTEIIPIHTYQIDLIFPSKSTKEEICCFDYFKQLKKP